MRFRVLTHHTNDHCSAIADDLKKRGFKIFDLREADILDDFTNEKESECYILCAKGSLFKYLKLRKEALKCGMKEKFYESYVTLM